MVESNHPKCRFGNHIQVVGVSREKKPLSLMFKVKIIRNFSSIIRAENERDTWFYEIQLFTIMRDIQVYTRICSSIQIKSNRLYRSQIWMISANIPMFSISPLFLQSFHSTCMVFFFITILFLQQSSTAFLFVSNYCLWQRNHTRWS